MKAAGNEEAQVRQAFEIVYQREPTPEELKASMLVPARCRATVQRLRAAR